MQHHATVRASWQSWIGLCATAFFLAEISPKASVSAGRSPKKKHKKLEISRLFRRLMVVHTAINSERERDFE
jgi:hypothetical protein